MILFLDNFFHIPVQMLPQKFPVRLLIQKPLEKLVHIMKHILQRFVQLSCIDQGRPEHIQIYSGIILKGKQCGIYILNI